MTTDTVPQTVPFPGLFDKRLHARFNEQQASSDGGALLLKATERIYGLVKAFAWCLFDKRALDAASGRSRLPPHSAGSRGTLGAPCGGQHLGGCHGIPAGAGICPACQRRAARFILLALHPYRFLS